MLAIQNIAFVVYFTGFFGGMPASNGQYNSSCGKDKSPFDAVYEGVAKIETYPWLGYLIYRSVVSTSRFTTTVVLVTKQIVIGTANEINQIPKYDFRARARVILGHNCSMPSIPVRDYTYHPDFIKRSHSALALIQLDLDFVRQELTPICPPPSYFIESVFYAMTLTPDCKKPVVQIYQMEYVDPIECKIYYRKSGVGFGIYGPGCEAPARFLDYGMYHDWIRQSVLRIGRPSITRIGSNQVILRRSLANVQRYGPCDYEEIKEELYTEETTVAPVKSGRRRVRYNMTVYANVEYSCVVFRANNFDEAGEAPAVRLRRWCAASPPACSGFQYIEIDFYVEVTFSGKMTFTMKAYGRKAVGIDIKRAMKYLNQLMAYPPILPKDKVEELILGQGTIERWAGRDTRQNSKITVTTKKPPRKPKRPHDEYDNYTRYPFDTHGPPIPVLPNKYTRKRHHQVRALDIP